MNCQIASVSCPNTQDISLMFGYLNPASLNPPLISVAKGVVVIMSGMGGTTPSDSGEGDSELADAYFKNGYEVVELEWFTPWEQTYNPFPVTSPPTYGNIQYAACRPATFLNFVDGQLFQSVAQSYPQAGMCAQAGSAGSAAVAYSLAYYGAGSYLDNVELTSGPVLSDIMQGCQEGPQASQVTVCGLNGGNQYGCNLGTGSTWQLYPTFLYPSNTSVGNWTNDSTCANTSMTSASANLRWLQQSIVDDGTNSPTFTYSSTAMDAWLCRTVANNGSPNNSSPQGQIFYKNITSSNSPYNVWAVNLCQSAEGAAGGHVGSDTGPTGISQITAHMESQCVHRNH